MNVSLKIYQTTLIRKFDQKLTKSNKKDKDFMKYWTASMSLPLDKQKIHSIANKVIHLQDICLTSHCLLYDDLKGSIKTIAKYDINVPTNFVMRFVATVRYMI